MSDVIVKLRKEYEEINPTSSFEYWLAYRIFELQAQVDRVRNVEMPSLKIKPEYKYGGETRSRLINLLNGHKRVLLRIQQALQESE